MALFALAQFALPEFWPLRFAVRLSIFIGLLVTYALVVRARERRLMETLEELEDRRQRFAAIFENSSEMMALYDVDGTIVRANHAALERLGFGDDVTGQRYEIHIVPEERPNVARAFAQATEGKGNEFATVFLDVHGQRVPVVANLSPIVVHGRVAGVACSARDVTAEQQYEEQLLRNRERFRGLFEQNPHAMLSIKADGTVSAINVAMERLSGYRNEEVVGKSAVMFSPEERRQLAEGRIDELATGQRSTSYESVLLCRGDHRIPVEVDVIPIRVMGKVDGFYMTLKDLTHEQAMSNRIARKDSRVSALYRVASSANNAAIQIDEALAIGAKSLSMEYGFVVDVRDNVLTVRHRYGPSDGLFPIGSKVSPTQAIGLRLLESPRALAVDDLTQGEAGAELRERNLPWRSCIGSRVAAHGKTYGVLLFLDTKTHREAFEPADVDFIDIVASLVGGAVSREIGEHELQEHSLRDPLTELPNRVRLEQAIARAIAKARRSRDGFALHFVDLDRFKPINDAYGHAEGDRVLQEIGRRLLSTIRAGDLAARVGGDEFVVLQTNAASDEATADLSRRIEHAVSLPIRTDDRELIVGCSVGIATFPKDGKNADELLRAADAAMYREKEHKRGA